MQCCAVACWRLQQLTGHHVCHTTCSCAVLTSVLTDGSLKIKWIHEPNVFVVAS